MARRGACCKVGLLRVKEGLKCLRKWTRRVGPDDWCSRRRRSCARHMQLKPSTTGAVTTKRARAARLPDTSHPFTQCQNRCKRKHFAHRCCEMAHPDSKQEIRTTMPLRVASVHICCCCTRTHRQQVRAVQQPHAHALRAAPPRLRLRTTLHRLRSHPHACSRRPRLRPLPRCPRWPLPQCCGPRCPRCPLPQCCGHRLVRPGGQRRPGRQAGQGLHRHVSVVGLAQQQQLRQARRRGGVAGPGSAGGDRQEREALRHTG